MKYPDCIKISFKAAAAILIASSVYIYAPPLQAQTLVERGKYLGEGIGGCGNCHTAKSGPMADQELAGSDSFGGPKAPFTSYASNITPDPETGIGKWTDAQIISAIREGKRPDGSVIGPPMPIEFFRYISDDDVNALVAWLRSVKPVKNQVQKSVYKIPLRAGEPTGAVANTPQTGKVKYGEYLARVGHCMDCHTPMTKGQLELATKLGAGGRKFEGPWGEAIAANITPDRETGIGGWSDEHITRAITKGVRANDVKMRPPMCYNCYDKMTASDIGAIAAYLRSTTPVKNDVLK